MKNLPFSLHITPYILEVFTLQRVAQANNLTTLRLDSAMISHPVSSYSM